MSEISWLAVAAAALVLGYVLGVRRTRRLTHRDAWARIRRIKRRLSAGEAEYARRAEIHGAAQRAVSEGLLLLDAQQKILEANGRACSWFDLDLRRQPSLMAGVGSADLREAVETVLRDPSLAREPIQVGIDGRVYRVQVEPIGPGGCLVALRDDTELQRLSRAQRDLVANVSHDLRTPLTSLSLLVDALLHGEPETDERRSLAARVRAQIATLETIADALIEISRLESGRALLRLEQHSLASIVTEAATGLAPQMEEANVRVRQEVSPSMAVLADRPQLVRAFTNLLDNARRFSPPAGIITVGARPSEEPDRVEVFVSDEGPGIPPSEVERVFERFYRADAARAGQGKGLGLAITKHIVTGHGGSIWVDQSERLKGTTIRLTLPCAN